MIFFNKISMIAHVENDTHPTFFDDDDDDDDE